MIKYWQIGNRGSVNERGGALVDALTLTSGSYEGFSWHADHMSHDTDHTGSRDVEGDGLVALEVCDVELLDE